MVYIHIVRWCTVHTALNWCSNSHSIKKINSIPRIEETMYWNKRLIRHLWPTVMYSDNKQVVLTDWSLSNFSDWLQNLYYHIWRSGLRVSTERSFAKIWSLVQRNSTGCVCLIAWDLDTSTMGRCRPQLICCAKDRKKHWILWLCMYDFRNYRAFKLYVCVCVTAYYLRPLLLLTYFL